MSELLATVVLFAILLSAFLLGIRLRVLIPEHHLSPDSRDTVKLAMGLVATMTAILLGLLVSSAKGAYETDRNDIVQMAAKVDFLDRTLALYGSEAAETRAGLRDLVAEAMHGMWPDHDALPVQLTPDARAGNAVYAAIHRLSPRDDMQRDLKAQALALTVELEELRTLLLFQAVPSISTPMLIAVTCWLVIIFVGFTLLAPPNGTTTTALIAAIASVAGAMFLILELDRPLEGFVRISSAPMLSVLSHLAK